MKGFVKYSTATSEFLSRSSFRLGNGIQLLSETIYRVIEIAVKYF